MSVEQINGVTIYPATGILVITIEAYKQLANVNRKIDGYITRDATFHKPPLTITTNPEGVEVQIYLHPLSDPSQTISST